MELTYYPTHTRMGAWLIGLLLSFVMHDLRGHTVIIRKVSGFCKMCQFKLITSPPPLFSTLRQHWATIGWSVSLATFFAVIFANYPLQSPDYPDSVVAGAAYESLSRISWAAAVAWLIFACAHGYGGPINWFLSLSGWQPLARLSYAIYIVHLPLQLVLAAQVRVPGYFSDLSAVSVFWSNFGLTLMVAVVWTLAFESPVLALERALTGRPSGQQQRRPDQTASSATDTSEATDYAATMDKRQQRRLRPDGLQSVASVDVIDGSAAASADGRSVRSGEVEVGSSQEELVKVQEASSSSAAKRSLV